MALILVVEPDRARAAQVTSLMRNHLRAQTIAVDCAVRARGALVYSIPDVILLSTLISTQDEAELRPSCAASATPRHTCRWSRYPCLRTRRRRRHHGADCWRRFWRRNPPSGHRM